MDFDGQVSVNGDGEETEDGALSQYQDETGHEEAAVEVQGETEADDDGEGDGQASHQNIGHGQRHQKVVGGVLQGAVDGDCPAHQHVAGYREDRDDRFDADIQVFYVRRVGKRWTCRQ